MDPKPVATTGGLWDELQASEKRMWYLCDVRTWRSHSQSRSMVGQAWARFSSCKPLDTIDTSNDIVLTFQYAENLENTSIVRAAGQAAVRAWSKFAVSHVGVGGGVSNSRRATGVEAECSKAGAEVSEEGSVNNSLRELQG